MDTLLEIDRISCGYGGAPVLHDFSLRLRPGGIACLLGPSGCGKTTALRAVAGFQPLTAGRVRLRGRTVSAPDLLLAPERRGWAWCFRTMPCFRT